MSFERKGFSWGGFFLKVGKGLGLVEVHQSWEKSEEIPNDVVIIPPGAVIEGQFHSNFDVVVAGKVNGSINLRGPGRVLVLEDAQVGGGMISADLVEIHGLGTDVALDVEMLILGQTGAVVGNSELCYSTYKLDPNSPLNGQLNKRRSPRDGLAHVANPRVEKIAHRRETELSN